MSKKVNDILKAIDALPLQDRILVAEKLLKSLSSKLIYSSLLFNCISIFPNIKLK